MRDFELSPGNHARMVQSEPPEINTPDGKERSDRKLSLSNPGSSLPSFISTSLQLESSSLSTEFSSLFSLSLLVVVAVKPA